MIKKDGSDLVIIIGAMKSGTTSLFKYLSQHPGILATKKTETHFFSKNFENGLDFYNNMWPDAQSNNILYLEATPGYYKSHIHDDIPQKIYNSYPKARLLFIVRHPIDRLESNYRQYINDSGNTDGINNNLPEELITSSMYYYQIKKFLPYFNKNQIMTLKTSDLRSKPNETLLDVCEFLQIPEFNFQNTSVKYGDKRVTNTNLYQNLRKFKLLKSLVKNIPQNYKYTLIKSFTKEKERISSNLWQLNDSNKEILLKEFEKDNEGMIREFNIDVLN